MFKKTGRFTIYNEIFYLRDSEGNFLNMIDHAILSKILEYNDKGCYLTQKSFAKLFGASELTILRSIKKLEKLSFIQSNKLIVSKCYDNNTIYNNRNIYTININNIINNKNKNNSFNNKLLKEKTENKFSVSLIKYWNSLKNIRKHKNKQTKVYKSSLNILNKLIDGKYFNTKKKFIDKIFMKNYNIPEEALKKKFTVEEIKDVMNKLDLLFTSDHGIKHSNYNKNNFILNGLKQNLSKAFPDLVYNTKTDKSWFLVCYYNEVKLISDIEQNENPSMDFDPEYFEIIKDSLSCKRINYFQKKNLISNINEMLVVQKYLSKRNGRYGKEDYIGNINDATDLFKYYIKWLEEWKNFKVITVGLFNIYSPIWVEFLNFLKDEWGIVIEWALLKSKGEID